MGAPIDAASTPRWRGVNHNIYSQSTWVSGDPEPGRNYARSDHRTIDYYHRKGINHLRMMFTWEWMEPDLHAGTLPAASLTYWHDVVDTVTYATDLGIHVTLAHYGWSNNYWPDGGGNTTPTWRGVGNGDGHTYTNQIGGDVVRTAEFVSLYSRLAGEFAGNDLVSFGLVNEPHDMDTVAWFRTVAAVVNAIREVGSAWILVPGNGYATYDVHNDQFDTATPRRSNAYGWDHAAPTDTALFDAPHRLVAECHIYLDDLGGTTLDIHGFRGGSPVHAARDRLAVMVDWARPKGLRVHVGEIGFSADTTGAGDTWASFVQYCDANSDVVTGFDWWGASDPGWWTDTGAAHFSVSPVTTGTIFDGDTTNMQMIQNAFAG